MMFIKSSDGKTDLSLYYKFGSCGELQVSNNYTNGWEFWHLKSCLTVNVREGILRESYPLTGDIMFGYVELGCAQEPNQSRITMILVLMDLQLNIIMDHYITNITTWLDQTNQHDGSFPFSKQSTWRIFWSRQIILMDLQLNIMRSFHNNMIRSNKSTWWILSSSAKSQHDGSFVVDKSSSRICNSTSWWIIT